MKQTDTYFKTQAGAIDAAIQAAQARGYEVVIPESLWTSHVDYCATVRYTLELKKGEKLQRKALQISLYRMDSGTYELTFYIS